MALARTHLHHHVSHAARQAGTVASQAESKQLQKYALLGNGHHFVPIAIETSGVFGPEALSFLKELGRRLKAETGEPRSLQFLLQGIAVEEAVLGTVPSTDIVYI